MRNPLAGGSYEDWKRAFDDVSAFARVESMLPDIDACLSQGTYLSPVAPRHIAPVGHALAGAMPKSSGETEMNFTVYTGLCGCALTYLRLGVHLRARQQADQALSCFRRARDVALRCCKTPEQGFRSEVSFLCGIPGAIAIAAACTSLLGEMEQAELLLHDLLAWHAHALAHAEDELLFGRAGCPSTIST
jgi:hypothetical protein